MVKRKLTLIDKIKIFRAWIVCQDGYGLIGECGCCHSTKLKRKEYIDYGTGNIKRYDAIYQCVNCGATASVTEEWRSQE